MADIDDATKTLLRRIEESVDLDSALAESHHRVRRARVRAVARRSIVATLALVVIGAAVVVRVRGGEDADKAVGASGTGAVASTSEPPGTNGQHAVPFLMLETPTWTLTSLMTFERSAVPTQAPGVVTSPPPTAPIAVYASASEDGPVVAIEHAAAQPETVGTNPPAEGEPFAAGEWHGTSRVTGSTVSAVRSAVVTSPDLAAGWLVVTGRQIDAQDFVDLVASIHRVGDTWRVADDAFLLLVSDGAERPNADSWTAEWQGPSGEIEINSYRETGVPRFVERLASSPTMTRIPVSGRPGAVFESGGYTVYSWLASSVDVIEIRVNGEGPAAVAEAAALARSARLTTEDDLRAHLSPEGQDPTTETSDGPGLASPSTLAQLGSLPEDCVVTNASPGGCITDATTAPGMLGFTPPEFSELPGALTDEQLSVRSYLADTTSNPTDETFVMASLLITTPGGDPRDPASSWLRLRVRKAWPSEVAARPGSPVLLDAPGFGGTIQASGVLGESSVVGAPGGATILYSNLEWTAEGYWYAFESQGLTADDVTAAIAALSPAAP